MDRAGHREQGRLVHEARARCTLRRRRRQHRIGLERDVLPERGCQSRVAQGGGGAGLGACAAPAVEGHADEIDHHGGRSGRAA
jgi:hypothetical protein